MAAKLENYWTYVSGPIIPVWNQGLTTVQAIIFDRALFDAEIPKGYREAYSGPHQIVTFPDSFSPKHLAIKVTSKIICVVCSLLTLTRGQISCVMYLT